MRVWKFSFGVLSVLCLLKLGDVVAADPPPGKAVSAAENAAMTKRIAALEKQVEDLTTRIFALQAALIIDSMRFSSAEFDPSEPKFQRIDAALSTFAVS